VPSCASGRRRKVAGTQVPSALGELPTEPCELAARRCEFDLPTDAPVEREAEIGLEAAHLHVDRRLRKGHQPSGTGEARRVGEGDEGRQEIEIHKFS
jgi:hypothetical protein